MKILFNYFILFLFIKVIVKMAIYIRAFFNQQLKNLRGLQNLRGL